MVFKEIHKDALTKAMHMTHEEFMTWIRRCYERWNK